VYAGLVADATGNRHQEEHVTEDKILERIAMLLRKAESTTSAEAEALTEHAERLMIRHGIEQARAEAAKLGRDVKREEITTLVMDLPTGHYSASYLALAASIADAYGAVRCYRWRYRGPGGAAKHELRIVGFQGDAEAVRTLILSLLLQGRTAMDAWHRKQSARGQFKGMAASSISKAKRDYLIGFGWGAAEKLRMLRTTVHAEAEDEQPGTAVALLDRKSAVDKFYDDIKGLKVHRTTVTNSALDGQADGRNANVGGGAVTGSRRALPTR
jgi:hypothetical protein